MRKYIKFPRINISEFDVPSDNPLGLTERAIEDLATETRRFWGIGDGPVSNCVLLLERNGVIVARDQLDSDKLDAFSEWNTSDGLPYVVLNSDKGCAARSRFDAGHELAHLILHRRVSEPTLRTGHIFSLMEEQANRFSGAFLLPEATFCRDLHTVSLDSLRVLKSKWRVSVGVMIKRASQLGVLSEADERRLWINYARRGWRKREPLDDELAAEQPRYIRRCVELLVERGIVPREEFPFRVGLPSRDIEHLVGLPEGFLESRQPDVEMRTEERAEVIPFPGA